MTVWLSPGPESCKVEPSLGCAGLDIGRGHAQIRWSGHRLAKAMNPGRRQRGPLRKLRGTACEERSRNGALNSVKPLICLHKRTAPTLTYNHAEHIVQLNLASTAGQIAHASTQQTLLAPRVVHCLCGLGTEGEAISLADAVLAG